MLGRPARCTCMSPAAAKSDGLLRGRHTRPHTHAPVPLAPTRPNSCEGGGVATGVLGRPGKCMRPAAALLLPLRWRGVAAYLQSGALGRPAMCMCMSPAAAKSLSPLRWRGVAA